MPKTYPPELKLVAIWLVEECGFSVARVAEFLGPHRKTVAAWVAHPNRDLWEAAVRRTDGGPPLKQSAISGVDEDASHSWHHRLEEWEEFAMPVPAVLILWLCGAF